jgi:hypothetical protein
MAEQLERHDGLELARDTSGVEDTTCRPGISSFDRVLALADVGVAIALLRCTKSERCTGRARSSARPETHPRTSLGRNNLHPETLTSTDSWNAMMQAEDLVGLPVAETREQPRADVR